MATTSVSADADLQAVMDDDGTKNATPIAREVQQLDAPQLDLFLF